MLTQLWTVRRGDVIQDRYRIESELGVGGVGAVYKVEHIAMAKAMAMKVLQPELTNIPTVSERFEREARSVARLDHHNIIRVNDFGKTDDGSLFLVMELLEGRTLAEHLRDHAKGEGGLEVDEALELIAQLLLGLVHAHRQGVVHRDLKPENVMIVDRDEGRVVKILDFGLAKLTEGVEEGPALTQAGMVFGTPRYMSPEQAAGESTDERTDVYSLGVMLFELLSGQPPFTGGSTVEVLTAHLTRAPPNLTLKDGRNETLDAVVQTALAKERGDRFPTVEAFSEAVSSIRAGNDSIIAPTHQKLEVPKATAPGPKELPFAAVTQVATDLALRLRERSSLLISHLKSRKLPFKPVAIAATGALAFAAIALLFIGGEVIETPQERFKEALVAGKLDQAALVLKELAKNPKDEVAIGMLEGHLALARGEFKAALAKYKRGLTAKPPAELGPTFERVFMSGVIKSPDTHYPIVEYLAKEGSPKTAPVLVRIFQEVDDRKSRRRAYSGLLRLKAIKTLEDPLTILIQDLKGTPFRSCKLRKWYVVNIKKFKDPRVAEALKHERNRSSSGNIIDRLGVHNLCMGSLLDSP